MGLNRSRRIRVALSVKQDFKGRPNRNPTTSVEPDPPWAVSSVRTPDSSPAVEPTLPCRTVREWRATQQHNYFFSKLYPFFSA